MVHYDVQFGIMVNRRSPLLLLGYPWPDYAPRAL